MREGGSEKSSSSSGMPAILVLILGILGLASIPQGGGKSAESPPRTSERSTKAGPSKKPGKDEVRVLGPLETIKSDRHHDTWATDPSETVEAERERILWSEEDLRFVIALVPDPEGTSMSHEFDATLSSVQRATESAGFVVARWSGMPGFAVSESEPSPAAPVAEGHKPAEPKDLERPSDRWPASILCRPTSAAETSAKTLLLILLVPESPTWGIDQDRFANALNLVIQYRELHKKPVASDPIRVIGPNFSGSIASIVRGLHRFSAEPVGPKPPLDVVIYNGRATGVDLDLFQGPLKKRIWFQSTTYSNANLTTAVQAFVEKITPPYWGAPARFAILNESNTAFGVMTHHGPRADPKLAEGAATPYAPEVQYFSFPMNISQIRDEYAARGYLKSNDALKLQSPERLSPLEMAGPRGDRDMIPTVTPGSSTVDAEMKLSQLLLSLERGRYNWIGINATNAYDSLFLAEKVRVACPDARLFFLEASTLYSHPSVVPYLRGSLIASAYPLNPDTQSWTASPGWRVGGNRSRLAFGNYYEEGVYNAAVAHLADMALTKNPKFLDYAYPGKDHPDKANPDKDPAVPSVWIGVIGQRGIYQLSVDPPDPTWFKPPDVNFPKIGGLYRPDPATYKFPPPPPIGNIDPAWAGLLFTVAFTSIIASLWYLQLFLRFKPDSRSRWAKRTHVRPGLLQIVNHHSARKLAAVSTSAGFGLMALLSSPLCVMFKREPTIWQNKGLVAWVIWIAVLPCLLLGTASAVALWRMLTAGGSRKLGPGELLYRLITGLIAIALLAMPVLLIADLLFNTDTAGLRLFRIRATRIVDGVTPMFPLLLLGLTGGIILLGDWRRIGLRIRLRATGNGKTLKPGPLAEAWEQFDLARLALDYPLKSWLIVGSWLALPVWVLMFLVAITFSHNFPSSIEPNRFFSQSFLMTFGASLVFLVIRIVELLGISRILDVLLRRLAELPMARAFDRVPAPFARENFWRPNSLNRRARSDSDPRLDRQFAGIVAGYEKNLASIKRNARLSIVDRTPLENLIAQYRRAKVLRVRNWWPAVGVLTPFLAPYWASRSAILDGVASDEGEWADLKNAELRRWLHSVEDLIALIMARQIAWLRAAVASIVSFLAVGLVTMSLVLTSYPFEPQRQMFSLIGTLTVITLGVVVAIAVQENRDEVLSRLNKTPTDRFTLDRQFVSTIITFVVPLLGLLGALSYSLSDLFRSLLEPFFRTG